jgi:hypothetical protein
LNSAELNNSIPAYHLYHTLISKHPISHTHLLKHEQNLQFAPIAFLNFNVTASASKSLRSPVCTSTAYVRITCFTCPDWKLILALRMTLVFGPVMRSVSIAQICLFLHSTGNQIARKFEWAFFMG